MKHFATGGSRSTRSTNGRHVPDATRYLSQVCLETFQCFLHHPTPNPKVRGRPSRLCPCLHDMATDSALDYSRIPTSDDDGVENVHELTRVETSPFPAIQITPSEERPPPSLESEGSGHNSPHEPPHGSTHESDNDESVTQPLSPRRKSPSTLLGVSN